MSTIRNLLLLTVTAGALTACDNGVSFAGSSGGSEGNFSVEPPSVITPPPPVEELPPEEVTQPARLKMKTGTCAADQATQVLSCLECQSSPDIPAPPILSVKAQRLLDIMTVACSIHNGSDPRGYVAPTRAQLLNRLIQCNPEAYPDTALVGTQQVTITKLLNDPTAQQSAFGGLYYNWAANDFTTYFGLDIKEARYTYCWGDSSFGSGGTYPIEYYQNLYSDSPTPYVLPTLWKNANTYRNQLRSCMSESLANPHVNQPPATPGKKCTYETAEGEMSEVVIEQANRWINQGHTVYFEGFNQCGVMERPEHLIDSRGVIKMAIKVCE